MSDQCKTTKCNSVGCAPWILLATYLILIFDRLSDRLDDIEAAIKAISP